MQNDIQLEQPEAENQLSRPKPAVLMVLDGFGVAPDTEGNSITKAGMQNFQNLILNYPAMTLRASGEYVGLSWGEMGNSEVGHLSIGAGRVYYQTLPRIDKSIETSVFFQNEAFLRAIAHAKENKSNLHLVGMLSPGGIHSKNTHCYALLKLAADQGIKKVFVHGILDGRDAVYNSGIDFINEFEEKAKEIGVGTLATLSGRYFTMDRDNRWDRIQKGYDAMVLGKGEIASDAISAIEASYAKEVFDEEFLPTVLTKKDKPIALIEDNDSLILFNFRPDRMREITKAFTLSGFDSFERTALNNIFVVTMAEYEEGLPVQVAFPTDKITECLAEVLSNQKLTQFHIAETEKYAHVTFFLNGTQEDPFEGEERAIIPSPKVESYDEVPAMSAMKVTDRVVKEIRDNNFDFIVMNLANPDMVGHTGNLEATEKAVKVIDGCIQRVADAVLEKDGVLFITADHGNAEAGKNLRTGDIDKEHSTNPVPFVIVARAYEGMPSISGPVIDGDLSLMSPVGMLADVAPTILSVLQIPQPDSMTGQPLL